MQGSSGNAWAAEEFGQLEVADRRLKPRILAMARGALERGGGRISEVFKVESERQGAYDLLEGGRVSAESLARAMSAACVERCRGETHVFVPIDGSSIHVVDRAKRTDLGLVGTHTNNARGVQVISALAVTFAGTPLGLCAQTFFLRDTRRKKKTPSKYRAVETRETQHVVDTIRDVTERYESSGCTPWIVIDRGGDATVILDELVQRKALFTVRASWNRRLKNERAPRYLRDALAKARVAFHDTVPVPKGVHRSARIARVTVRTAVVKLNVSHDWKAKRENPTLNVVWVHEAGGPRGEKPLDWMLYTSAPIDTPEAIRLVIRSYKMRWRIEDFHKTWKSGYCHVEDTQLRSARAVKTWATLLAAVAARIERLRHLARNEPESPASIELSDVEIKALKLLKLDQKKKTEVIGDGMPSIAVAVRWIADLGGYTGRSSGGPPGAITIGRGLEELGPAARLLNALRKSRKMR